MVDYVKYRMWLPIFATPFMVFWARPQSRLAWRIGRLVAAVAIFYIALNGVLYLQSRLEWSTINAFRDQNPECWLQPCKGERKPTVDGPNFAFAMVFGWVPALIYVGLWELGWRVRYRKAIKAFSQHDIGLSFSTILIFFSIFLCISLYLFMVYLFSSFYEEISILYFYYAFLTICMFIIVFLSMLMPSFLQEMLINIARDFMIIIDVS